jgi:hypothetical protein
MLCSCVGYPFVMLIVGEFSFALSPHPPLISMLWRALFVHLRNLFCDKADAAQGIKEENNIEIGGAGGNAKTDCTKTNTAQRKPITNYCLFLLAK